MESYNKLDNKILLLQPEIYKFKKHLSKSIIYKNQQLSYLNYFQNHIDEGRHLFHLTVTYKPFQHREYKSQDINKFFTNFYVKLFLPLILKTRNIHTKYKRSIQPITFTFIDEGSHSSMIKVKEDGGYLYNVFSDRLHHHAILSIHPTTIESLIEYVGINTFPKSKFSAKIMTTDLKKCEIGTVLYASKMIEKYNDYLCYPDKLVNYY